MNGAASALRATYKPILATHRPILDFLAPALSVSLPTRRHASTAGAAAQTVKTPPNEKVANSATTPLKKKPLSREQRDFLDSAVRTPPFYKRRAFI